MDIHTCTNCNRKDTYLMFPYEIRGQKLEVKNIREKDKYIGICKHCTSIFTIELAPK